MCLYSGGGGSPEFKIQGIKENKNGARKPQSNWIHSMTQISRNPSEVPANPWQCCGRHHRSSPHQCEGGGPSLRRSPHLHLVPFLKSLCPCHLGKKVTHKRKAQSFRTDELMKLWVGGISRKFSCQLLAYTVDPARHKPELKWTGVRERHVLICIWSPGANYEGWELWRRESPWLQEAAWPPSASPGLTSALKGREQVPCLEKQPG